MSPFITIVTLRRSPGSCEGDGEDEVCDDVAGALGPSDWDVDEVESRGAVGRFTVLGTSDAVDGSDEGAVVAAPADASEEALTLHPQSTSTPTTTTPTGPTGPAEVTRSRRRLRARIRFPRS
jgi:hypothetical protein